jgi:hypothetical protein
LIVLGILQLSTSVSMYLAIPKEESVYLFLEKKVLVAHTGQQLVERVEVGQGLQLVCITDVSDHPRAGVRRTHRRDSLLLVRLSRLYAS